MSVPAVDVPATGHAIRQIALVVRDLDRAMANWYALGVGPWRVYTFGPHNISTMTLHGRTMPHTTVKIAFASVGTFSYELIQPLQGASIYEEFLASHGEGLHHLGYYVDDIDAAIEAMQARGYAVMQSGTGHGLDRDGAYAYFDTANDIGCILEAMLRPTRMPAVERQFPQIEPT